MQSRNITKAKKRPRQESADALSDTAMSNVDDDEGTARLLAFDEMPQKRVGNAQ